MKNIRWTKSAIIPFLKSKEGIKILVVRNHKDTKWVIPKGTVSKPLKPMISAIKEAYEEAGVLGKPHPLMLGFYLKQGVSVPTFLLEVDVVLKEYAESEVRQRLWISPDKIDETIEDLDLRHIVKEGVRCIQKRGTYFRYLLSSYAAEIGRSYELVSKKYIKINFPTDVDTFRTVHVRRFKGKLEFFVFSRVVPDVSKKRLSEVQFSLLTENARHKIGYWCIKKRGEELRYTSMHNIDMSVLSLEVFNDILQGLIANCQTFEHGLGSDAPTAVLAVDTKKKEVKLKGTGKEK